MEITDHFTCSHSADMNQLNISSLISILESNGIKIDLSNSEKIVKYWSKIHPFNSQLRISYLPMEIDTQELEIAGYILRSDDIKGRLEIELENSPGGGVPLPNQYPLFKILVQANSDKGMELFKNVRDSLVDFDEKYLGIIISTS